MEIFKDMKKDRKRELFRLVYFAILIGLMTYIRKIFGNKSYVVTGFLFIYLFLGMDVFLEAIESFSKRNMMDENFLLTIASFAAFFMGNFTEACVIMLLFSLGEVFENLANDRTDKNIKSFIDIVPKKLDRENPDGSFSKVSINEINVGDIILAKDGDRIGLEGIVVDGEGLLDTSSLTGESMPVDVRENSKVLSSSILKTGIIKYRVQKVFDQSIAYKIISLIKNSPKEKSDSEKLIRRFAKVYTPFVVAIAVFLAVVPPILFGNFASYLKMAGSFLILSCPGALLIGLPLTYVSGLGLCSKNKILVKGARYFEKLIDADYFYTDKTGTLTYGDFDVKDIIYYSEYNKNLILDYLYNLEKLSNHPIAKAIVKDLRRRDNPSYFIASESINGLGIWAKTYENEEIKIGSKDFVNINEDSKDKAIYMTINDILVCKVLLEDRIKDDAKETIDYLRSKFSDIAVLSGDSEMAVKDLAEELSISYAGGLLPNEKLDLVKNEQKNGHKIVFVGDGINDGPVLKYADVGISMGQGASDLAIDASDIIISDKSYSKLKDLMEIARIVDKTAKKNLVFIMLTKIIILILTLLGYGPMWLAIVGDVGVLILSIFISTSILNKKI